MRHKVQWLLVHLQSQFELLVLSFKALYDLRTRDLYKSPAPTQACPNAKICSCSLDVLSFRGKASSNHRKGLPCWGSPGSCSPGRLESHVLPILSDPFLFMISSFLFSAELDHADLLCFNYILNSS